MSQNRGAICQNRLLLTDGFDFWEDLSRTSSKDRSESSEKLRFWLAFKSGSKALAKVTEQCLDTHPSEPRASPPST